MNSGTLIMHEFFIENFFGVYINSYFKNDVVLILIPEALLCHTQLFYCSILLK